MTDTNPLEAALTAAESQNGADPKTSGEKRQEGHADPFPPLIATFPRALGENAYCGLAGEIVRAIEPYTEADPAAVIISVLTMFGNAIGRKPYFIAGDAEHATNLFALIVGETDSGRKGTATESPRRIIGAADETWKCRVRSGLASGEGIIHHVRDERSQRRKVRKGELGDSDGMVEELVDPGVEDKRLMVFESEFVKVLAVAGRKDSTLSAVLREAWDRGDLQTLSKNSPEQATGALVSVLAQITPFELEARLTSTDMANGFMNRFVIIAAKRSKLLPRGGNVPPAMCASFGRSVADALTQARRLTEVDMTPEAWQLWEEKYESLVTRPRGLVGTLTARATPMVRRFALLYALMDERSNVHVQHLEAALELWRYVEESSRWVFGDRFGDWVADDCLLHLRDAGDTGLTRTELRDQLGHRVSSGRTQNALGLLASLGLARTVKEPTSGRSVERWFAITPNEEDDE